MKTFQPTVNCIPWPLLGDSFQCIYNCATVCDCSPIVWLLQGERLSHAVGCAFAICLEKKQQREKEKVTVTYNENGTSFTRLGSFRQTTLTERLQDPQSAILAGQYLVE